MKEKEKNDRENEGKKVNRHAEKNMTRFTDLNLESMIMW